MSRRTTSLIIAGGVLCFAALAVRASADCDHDELVGYTVVAHTSVNGDFEGCDFDRVIRYLNGMKTTCAEYSYTYAYAPDATLYVGPVFRVGATNGFCGARSVKACIEDDLYDMQPILVKCPPTDSSAKK